MFDFIQNSYACIGICIFFIAFVICDKSFDRKTEILFVAATLNIIILSIVDWLEIIEAAKPELSWLRYFYSSVGYSLRPLSAIYILFIMERRRVKANVNFQFLGLLPFLLNTILCSTSSATKLVFYYDEYNSFYRGPLGILPFATGGLYLLAMMAATFINRQKRQKPENYVVLMIGLISMAAAFVETELGYYGILNTACAAGCVFYYLYIHVSVYSTDLLTGVLSRRIFYLDIEKLGKKSAVVVELDLNSLKLINDEGGHSAGDKALTVIANFIKENLNPGCSLYRTGGDEFMILCRGKYLEEVNSMMEKMFDENDTPYSFAWGAAEYESGDNIDAVCDMADLKMYGMKTEMKAKRA